ncbi:MAG: FAD binding domain-containing protein, partial [Actinomycetota bacterium]
MKPAPFRYLRPSSVDEVVAVLAEHRADATVLAGGQSLLPLLNQRHRRPTVVVDLTAVTELRRVVTGGDEVELGALVGQQLPAAVAPSLPLLVLALPHVGHVQTRNRGTIAGSVAHGDPLAEVPLAMLVGGGAVELVSARGRRLVPIDDFLDRAFAPARADDELVVATHWARPEPGVGHGFVELTSGTTVAAAAAVASVDGGRVESVRVGVAGPVDRPMLITAELLPPVDGTDPGAVTALGRRLGSGLVDGVAFIDDTTSHSAHRRAVAVELVCRALRAAVADGMRGADEEKSADAPG